MSKKEKEYRVTRSGPYESEHCPGHWSCEPRQGYYIFAETPMGAVAQMFRSFPDELIHGFTITERDDSQLHPPMWTWTMEGGLRSVDHVDQSIQLLLGKMFADAERQLKDPEVRDLVKRLGDIKTQLEE